MGGGRKALESLAAYVRRRPQRGPLAELLGPMFSDLALALMSCRPGGDWWLGVARADD